MRHSVWSLAAVSAVVSLVAGACVDSDDPVDTGIEASSESSPFTVSHELDGLSPVTAGRGTQLPDWGSDSAGTDEPFTVVSPDGTATQDEAVVVSITGFEGRQGRLAQASRSYLSVEGEQFTVDGQDAIHTPRASNNEWEELLVVRGEDLAVRLTSRSASREQLLALLERVEVPTDRSRAPTVDPPDGFEVVGSIDAGAAAALLPVGGRDGAVPGPSSAHGAGWMTPASDTAQVAVLTLPGTSVDLAALPGLLATYPASPPLEVTLLELDGRPAVRLHSGDDEWQWMSLWALAEWGDVVVGHSRDLTLVSEQELTALVGSVERADEAAWAEFIAAGQGGPGLNPDPGRTEITRGRVGDDEWLLQSAPGAVVVDSCLKLSTGQRRCADDARLNWPDLELRRSYDGWLILLTSVDAVTVRATQPDGSVITTPLVELSEDPSRRAAVVFGEPPGTPVCPGDPVGLPEGSFELEALDADGRVVACLARGEEPG